MVFFLELYFNFLKCHFNIYAVTDNYFGKGEEARGI